jgi:hypothetical protein
MFSFTFLGREQAWSVRREAQPPAMRLHEPLAGGYRGDHLLPPLVEN